MLQEKHEAKGRLKDTFRDRARTSGLPVTWRPGLAALSEVFVAAVAHGRFSQDGEIVQARPDLARLTGTSSTRGCCVQKPIDGMVVRAR